MTWRFTIIGAPRTKGNSRCFARAGSKPRFLPSKPYRRWFKMAMQQLPFVRQATGIIVPLNMAVHVKAIFFRECAVGDLDNYAKGCGDYLQRARLIENDKQIKSWDGSRLEIDRERPRLEIEITPLTGVMAR